MGNRAMGHEPQMFGHIQACTLACLRLTVLNLPSCAIPHGSGYFTAISNSATRPELLRMGVHIEAQKCIKLIIL